MLARPSFSHRYLQLGQRQIVRHGDLRGAFVAGHGGHRDPGRTDDGRVVRQLLAGPEGGVGGDQRAAVEALGRLHPAQRGTRNDPGQEPAAVDRDDGVHHGKHGDDGACALAQRGQHAGHDVRRGERAGGVVDEDGVGVGCRGVEGGAHRRGAGGAAVDQEQAGPEDRGESLALGGGDGDDDLRHATGAECLDRPAHQRAAGQRDERLRDFCSQTQTTPGRCDDADSAHGSGLGVSVEQ
jgi:hypothetical protein